MPFLHVIESSEVTRTVRVQSNRGGNPKGTLVISVSERADSRMASTLRISTSDEQIITDILTGRVVFGPNVKGTLPQMLIGIALLIDKEYKN